MNNKKPVSTNLNRRDMLKYGLSLGLLGGISPGIWVSGCNSRGRKRRPNIFFITVDTLRADHLSCYGYPKSTSPHIDSFAQQATLFKHCFSHASNTWSSLASMLSGFLPHEVKIFAYMLPLEVKTLPEILLQQGYKTIGVVSNYILRKNQGYEQGFEVYDDTMNDFEIVRRGPERIAKNTTDRAIELLKESSKQQIFMWVHYQDPHGPYTPPDRFSNMFKDNEKKPRGLKLNTSLSGLGGIPSYQRLNSNNNYHHYVSQYDAEICYFDENFKRLIDEVKRLGLYDDSLIIFTADHGEDMGSHNYYFSHGENLYNSLIHVPLIIKQSKTLSGMKTNFVQQLDIIPTIFNMTDIKSELPYRGFDLFEHPQRSREIISETSTVLVANKDRSSIINDGFKLIHTYSYKKTELFDLNTDFNEEKDLFNDHKYRQRANDLFGKLKSNLEKDLLDLGDISKPKKKLSEEEIKKLKSLGYAQ